MDVFLSDSRLGGNVRVPFVVIVNWMLFTFREELFT